MCVIIGCLLFISAVLLAIMGDIARMKDAFEKMCQIMWRESMLNTDASDDEDEDDI